MTKQASNVEDCAQSRKSSHSTREFDDVIFDKNTLRTASRTQSLQRVPCKFVKIHVIFLNVSAIHLKSLAKYGISKKIPVNYSHPPPDLKILYIIFVVNVVQLICL